MQTIVAVVREIHGATAYVDVESGGCGRCHEPGGCGGQHLTQALCSTKRFRVANALGAGIGDRVRLGIDEARLRSAAHRAYLMPLALFLAGALLGAPFGSVPSVSGAFAGLLLAWGILVVTRPEVEATPRMTGFESND